MKNTFSNSYIWCSHSLEDQFALSFDMMPTSIQCAEMHSKSKPKQIKGKHDLLDRILRA